MKLRLLLLLAVLVVVGGCLPPMPEKAKIDRGRISDLTHLGSVGWPDVYRFIDRDADVVCWMSTESRGSGISCLPLSATALGE